MERHLDELAERERVARRAVPRLKARIHDGRQRVRQVVEALADDLRDAVDAERFESENGSDDDPVGVADGLERDGAGQHRHPVDEERSEQRAVEAPLERFLDRRVEQHELNGGRRQQRREHAVQSERESAGNGQPRLQQVRDRLPAAQLDEALSRAEQQQVVRREDLRPQQRRIDEQADEELALDARAERERGDRQAGGEQRAEPVREPEQCVLQPIEVVAPARAEQKRQLALRGVEDAEMRIGGIRRQHLEPGPDAGKRQPEIAPQQEAGAEQQHERDDVDGGVDRKVARN